MQPKEQRRLVKGALPFIPECVIADGHRNRETPGGFGADVVVVVRVRLWLGANETPHAWRESRN